MSIQKKEIDNYIKIVINYNIVNFRYVFRYVLLGLPGATECSKVLQSAEKNHKMLSKVAKNPKSFVHVDRERSISSAAGSEKLQGFARIWIFEKGEKRELDTF